MRAASALLVAFASAATTGCMVQRFNVETEVEVVIDGVSRTARVVSECRLAKWLVARNDNQATLDQTHASGGDIVLVSGADVWSLPYDACREQASLDRREWTFDEELGPSLAYRFTAGAIPETIDIFAVRDRRPGPTNGEPRRFRMIAGRSRVTKAAKTPDMADLFPYLAAVRSGEAPGDKGEDDPYGAYRFSNLGRRLRYEGVIARSRAPASEACPESPDVTSPVMFELQDGQYLPGGPLEPGQMGRLYRRDAAVDAPDSLPQTWSASVCIEDRCSAVAEDWREERAADPDECRVYGVRPTSAGWRDEWDGVLGRF